MLSVVWGLFRAHNGAYLAPNESVQRYSVSTIGAGGGARDGAEQASNEAPHDILQEREAVGLMP